MQAAAPKKATAPKAKKAITKKVSLTVNAGFFAHASQAGRSLFSCNVLAKASECVCQSRLLSEREPLMLAWMSVCDRLASNAEALWMGNTRWESQQCGYACRLRPKRL